MSFSYLYFRRIRRGPLQEPGDRAVQDDRRPGLACACRLCVRSVQSGQAEGGAHHRCLRDREEGEEAVGLTFDEL